jgi:hypothetical protein
MDEELLMDRILEFVANSYPESDPESDKKVPQYSCTKCDKIIRVEDRFCWYCGDNVTDPQVPEGGYSWAVKEYGAKKRETVEESEEILKTDKTDSKSKKKKVTEDEEEKPKKKAGRPKKAVEKDDDEDEPEVEDDDDDEDEPEVEDDDEAEVEDDDEAEVEDDDEDEPEVEDDDEDEPEVEEDDDDEEKPKKGKKSNKGKISKLETKFEVSDEPESEDDDSGLSLSDRVETIRNLEHKSGEGAWEIGQHLDKICRGKLYRSKYKKFDEFVKKDLNYCHATARSYIKLYKKFTLEESRLVGRTNLFAIANNGINDKNKKKLIAMATSEEKPISTRELKDKVQEMLGKDKVDKPKPNPWTKFVGVAMTGKIKKKKDKQVSLITINDLIGAEIEINDKEVSLSFVELEG